MKRGVWKKENQTQIDVALKTLNKGSSKEDEVKFLQEAAIMAQFRHPNVVILFGVVTEGEPVSVCVCLSVTCVCVSLCTAGMSVHLQLIALS